MKSVNQMKSLLADVSTTEQTHSFNIGVIVGVLTDALNHIGRLNGRSDIMAEVAEGNMMIVRRDEYVPKSLYQQRDRSFVKVYRELLALGQAVNDCEAGMITVNSIRHRQSDLLARDDEYQRAIRPDLEAALRRTKSAYKEWGHSRTMADISAGDPIVDRNSYNVPDQYDRMDFRKLAEAIVARGGLYALTADTRSQTEDMRRWLRDDDAVNINSANFLKNVLLAKPHTFIRRQREWLKTHDLSSLQMRTLRIQRYAHQGGYQCKNQPRQQPNVRLLNHQPNPQPNRKPFPASLPLKA